MLENVRFLVTSKGIHVKEKFENPTHNGILTEV